MIAHPCGDAIPSANTLFPWQSLPLASLCEFFVTDQASIKPPHFVWRLVPAQSGQSSPPWRYSRSQRQWSLRYGIFAGLTIVLTFGFNWLVNLGPQEVYLLLSTTSRYWLLAAPKCSKHQNGLSRWPLWQNAEWEGSSLWRKSTAIMLFGSSIYSSNRIASFTWSRGLYIIRILLVFICQHDLLGRESFFSLQTFFYYKVYQCTFKLHPLCRNM